MTTVEQAEIDLIARTRALIPEPARERRRRRPPGASPRTSKPSKRRLAPTVQARRNGGYGLGMHATRTRSHRSQRAAARRRGLGRRALVAPLPLPSAGSGRRLRSGSRLGGRSGDRSARVGTRLRRQPHALGLLAVRIGNENASWLLLGAVCVTRRAGSTRVTSRCPRRASSTRTIGSSTGSPAPGRSVSVEKASTPRPTPSLVLRASSWATAPVRACEGWAQRCARPCPSALALTGGAIGYREAGGFEDFLRS